MMRNAYEDPLVITIRRAREQYEKTLRDVARVMIETTVIERCDKASITLVPNDLVPLGTPQSINDITNDYVPHDRLNPDGTYDAEDLYKLHRVMTPEYTFDMATPKDSEAMLNGFVNDLFDEIDNYSKLQYVRPVFMEFPSVYIAVHAYMVSVFVHAVVAHKVLRRA